MKDLVYKSPFFLFFFGQIVEDCYYSQIDIFSFIVSHIDLSPNLSISLG
jgi:hypothetical protein